MRDRMLRIGVIVVVLFAINAAARLVGRVAYGGDTPADLEAQDRLGWFGWGVIALVMAVAAAWWIRRRPQQVVAGDLAIAAGVTALLYVTVGPWLSQPPRFEEGISGAIVQMALYLVVAGAGALVGAMAVTALGKDYQSQELRRYAESRAGKPHRPIRR